MPCRTFMPNICPLRGERGSVKGWEQSRFPTWICAAVVAPPRRRRPTSGQCRSSQPLLQSTLFLHASYTVVLASALLRLVKERRGRRTANFSERSGTEARKRGGGEFSFLLLPLLLFSHGRGGVTGCSSVGIPSMSFARVDFSPFSFFCK